MTACRAAHFSGNIFRRRSSLINRNSLPRFVWWYFFILLIIASLFFS